MRVGRGVHREWRLIVLFVWANGALCYGQLDCALTEISRQVNVSATDASFASTGDLPRPPGDCPVSLTWDLAAAGDVGGDQHNGSWWISVEVLDLAVPVPFDEFFSLRFSAPAGVAAERLIPGLHRVLFASAGDTAQLSVTYLGYGGLLAGDAFWNLTVARLTLSNETDCGQHFECGNKCLDSAVVCDGSNDCEFRDELNCEACGETTFDLSDGGPVRVTTPPPVPGIPGPFCAWLFVAPRLPGVRIQLRFLEYTTGAAHVFGVARELDFEDWLLQRPFQVLAAAPKVRVFDEQRILVIYGEYRDALPTESSLAAVIRFEISALNETVECVDGEFSCDAGTECVNNSLRCDGYPHCDDYSDELGCSVGCGAGELSCTQDSQEACVTDSQICDSRKDCDDFVDEVSCVAACGEQHVRLRPNQTRTLASPNAPAAHPWRSICVWFVTAPARARIVVRADRLNLNAGSSLTLGDGPDVSANATRILWRRSGGTAPSLAVSPSNAVWVVFEDSSGYPLAVRDAHFVLSLSVVEDSVDCSVGNQFACEDGYQCIKSSEVCDGVVQCFDLSDEMSCSDQCPNRTAACFDADGNTICFDEHDFCNGLPFCANYMDESLCSNICGERHINLDEYPDFTYNLSSHANGFPPYTACVWIFTARPGLSILLDLLRQQIGDADYFTIGEGADPGNASSILGYVAGTQPPSTKQFSDGLWMALAASSGEFGSFSYRITAYNGSGSCGEDQFQCSVSGLCIDDAKHCDGVFSCDDSTDETGCDHCGGFSIINVTDGQSFVLRMSYAADDVNFPFGHNCVWYVVASPGRRVLATFREYQLAADNGLFFGHGDVRQSNAEAASGPGTQTRARIVSETDTLWIALIAARLTSANHFELEIDELRPVECNQDEYTCPSGLACIPFRQVCDGRAHCPMRGDEIGCGSCADREYMCPEGVCVSAVRDVCNAMADCLDLGDETDCLACGESDVTLSNATARLTSASYPDNYPNDALCVWFVTADAGSAVAFRFSAFHTELHYDIVTVGNGHAPSDEGSVIGRFSGSPASLGVVSKGRTAWMRFKSDFSVTRPGLEVTVRQENSNVSCGVDELACQDTTSGVICFHQNDTCDGFALCPDGSDETNCGECGPQNIYVYEEPIVFKSPYYPNFYPDDLNCFWNIWSERDLPLTARIEEFATEENFDYLVVTYFGAFAEPQELFRLTGTDVSTRTVTWHPGDGHLGLQMKTDRTNGDRGFAMTLSHYRNYTPGESSLATLCRPDEFHCGEGFCVAESSRCNGYLDCLNYQDEQDCSDVFCPGSYKCDDFQPTTLTTQPPHHDKSSSSSSSSDSLPFPYDWSSINTSPDVPPQAQCIPRAQVCDGEANCPESDDEIECDTKRCPAGCGCRYSDANFVVHCDSGWNSSTLADLAQTTHTLQLSGVNIRKLDQGMFKAMSHLKVLSLTDSFISEIQKRTFDGLDNLLWLTLSNTSINELKSFAMEELSNLQGITIFGMPLTRIKPNAFAGLGQVKTLILVRNIKGLPAIWVEDDAFEGLQNLTELYVDDHRVCCFFPSAKCKTLEPQPPLFMCSELMPKLVLKVFMWILGISALVGNVFVMVWRCREKTDSRSGRASRAVQSYLVFNLAVSDALMGLYMLIIAGADAYFGGRYSDVSSEWRASPLCKVAGFVSIVGSEASVFFLTLISVDRFLCIVFPFSVHHLRPTSARVAAGCVWAVTAVVGVVPTVLASDSASDVYGLSDVCIGLPLMTKATEYETVDQQVDAGGVANITVGIPRPVGYRASWFFSIALFLGVNLLCFAVILACYVAIFVRVKSSMRRVRRHKKADDEVRLAVKMAAIVATDFVCWIPVIVMGILSQARVVEIPTEAYAWIVVFILPINSSLNPYLYTVADLCSQQRRSASVRKSGLPARDSRSDAEKRISSIANSVTVETRVDEPTGHKNDTSESKEIHN